MSFGITLVMVKRLEVGSKCRHSESRFEVEAIGVVDDAVEDGIGDGRFADGVVPAIDRGLADDWDCTMTVALLDVLQRIVALVRFEQLPATVYSGRAGEPMGMAQSWTAVVAGGQ